jgi:hypothetical protein
VFSKQTKNIFGLNGNRTKLNLFRQFLVFGTGPGKNSYGSATLLITTQYHQKSTDANKTHYVLLHKRKLITFPPKLSKVKVPVT